MPRAWSFLPEVPRAHCALSRDAVMVMQLGPRTTRVELRASEASDGDFLFTVYASSRREPLAPLGWDAAAEDAFLRTQFDAEERDWRNRRSAQCHVVLRDGEPVGRLYVARNQHELRVMDITLLPEHRAQGVGTALVHELLREARATRRTVRIHVERTSPAVPWFRRLGFLHAATRGTTWLLEWTPGVNA